MKFIGWLLGFIVLLLVLVVAAGAGLIYYVHNTDQRALAQNILKDQTKLEVTFGEELSIKLWPQLEVRASGIRIADHFNDETPLVSVEQLHVLADWRDVLQRKSLAEQVVISRPQVDLYRRADGRANWEPPRQGRSSGGSPDVLGLLALVQHVEVSDAGLTMVDETVGQRQVWSNFQLGLGATSDTARRQLNVTGLVDGQPLTVRLSFDASHAKRLPLEAEVRAPSVVLSANGVVRGLPSRAAFNGTITAESADLVPLLQRFQPGMALPVTTLPFSLQTEAELSAKVFNLQSFNLSRTPWGDFRGQMALELGKLPYQFTADITSDNLNMAPFGLCGAANQRANQGSSAGRTSTAGGQQTPWSSDPIDVSFVQLVQGQLSFNALGFAPCTGWPLQSVRLAAEWDDQRLALSQLNLTNRVAGSLQASGQLGLTGQRRGGFTATLDGFELGAVLPPQQANKIQIPLDGTLDLTFAGPNTQAWARSVGGALNLSAAGGRLPDLSVLGLLQFLNGEAGHSGSQMALRDLQVRYSLADGVARAEVLQLETPNFMLTGEGKIDIANWTINHTLTSDIAGGAVRVPVAVRGNLYQPSILPQAVNSTNVSAGVGALIGGPVGAGLGAIIGQQLRGEEGAADTSPTQLNIEVDQLQQEVEEGVRSIFQGLGLQ